MINNPDLAITARETALNVAFLFKRSFYAVSNDRACSSIEREQYRAAVENVFAALREHVLEPLYVTHPEISKPIDPLP